MPKYKEENKVRSIFKVLRYILEDTQSYTIEQLSKKTNINARTIRRYLDEDLPDLGFPIEKDEKSKSYKLISKQVPISLSYGFSMEEVLLLKDLLVTLPNSPLKQSILSKIFYESELKNIAENFFKNVREGIIQKLSQAIEQKKRAILKKYHSIASQSVKDRLVEPICFTHNFTQIRAYELEKQEVRNFSIQRIDAVEIIDQPRSYQGELYPTDAFGFSDKEELFIVLELSEKAYLLLREEFPLTEPALKKEQNTYFFRGFVRSYKGIGRFILSLPGEIKVVEDEGLKNFLQNEIKKFKF
ncbi:MAG: hypothetical protein OHK0038_00520 [Flammeovirgaceae bacterium]